MNKSYTRIRAPWLHLCFAGSISNSIILNFSNYSYRKLPIYLSKYVSTCTLSPCIFSLCCKFPKSKALTKLFTCVFGNWNTSWRGINSQCWFGHGGKILGYLWLLSFFIDKGKVPPEVLSSACSFPNHLYRWFPFSNSTFSFEDAIQQLHLVTLYWMHCGVPLNQHVFTFTCICRKATGFTILPSPSYHMPLFSF